MRLPQPLHSGRLIKRYKRFLADVTLDDGEVITAHCADPGRLPGLAVEDAQVWLSKSDDPKRKLAYRLEIIEHHGQLVGLNTNNANHLAQEALATDLPSAFAGALSTRREVKYGDDTRFDFTLEQSDGTTLWLEVKNVTWRDRSANGGGLAFPDAVTARGTKHLQRLTEIAEKGGRAALLFMAQRCDGHSLRIAHEIDPAYAAAFKTACAAGVEVRALACTVDFDQIVPKHEIDIDA